MMTSHRLRAYPGVNAPHFSVFLALMSPRPPVTNPRMKEGNMGLLMPGHACDHLAHWRETPNSFHFKSIPYHLHSASIPVFVTGIQSCDVRCVKDTPLRERVLSPRRRWMPVTCLGSSPRTGMTNTFADLGSNCHRPVITRHFAVMRTASHRSRDRSRPASPCRQASSRQARRRLQWSACSALLRK